MSAPEGWTEVLNISVTYIDPVSKEAKVMFAEGRGALLIKQSAVKGDPGQPATPTRALSITMPLEGEEISDV